MPSGFQYPPERNARAYATHLLVERLHKLNRQRTLAGATSSLERWRETKIICNELMRRAEAIDLVAFTLSQGPEVANKPPIVDYPPKKAA